MMAPPVGAGDARSGCQAPARERLYLFMHIAINAFPLRRDGGGARYAFAGLLSALLRVEGEHRYLVFVHLEGLQLVYGILKSLGETMGGTGPDPRVRVIHIRD